MDDASPAVHQAVRDGGDPIGMAGAACTLRIRKIARKRQHAVMGVRLEFGIFVSRVAGDAFCRRKCMRGAETRFLVSMTAQAGARFGPGCARADYECNNCRDSSVRHSAATITIQRSRV